MQSHLHIWLTNSNNHLDVLCREPLQVSEECKRDHILSETKKIAVIIVAGGKGMRALSKQGAELELPKQYQMLAGKAVFDWSIEAFLRNAQVDCILPVISAQDKALYAQHVAGQSAKLLPPVIGGVTRQLSVLAGLKALQPRDIDQVLIHDAARPLVSQDVIKNVLQTLTQAGCALPSVGVVDTIKRSNDGQVVLATEDREKLFAAQTPQGFDYKKILAAHQEATTKSDAFTDDTAIAEWAGMQVRLCAGASDNIKITRPEDFERAAFLLQKRHNMTTNEYETRVGTGFDIHPFVSGDSVTLGGVNIPHSAKLKGHSDADAALHVLTDSILGALAEGDIGTHFPPTDMKWRGESSTTFLSFAAKRVKERQGRIINLDLTIVCEFPKIGPHVSAMRERIAQICNIDVSRVSVKATTSERMGFIGREEGLATIGAVSIEVPRQI